MLKNTTNKIQWKIFYAFQDFFIGNIQKFKKIENTKQNSLSGFFKNYLQQFDLPVKIKLTEINTETHFPFTYIVAKPTF